MINILSIGNSFSVDALAFFSQIANAADQEHSICISEAAVCGSMQIT